MFCLRISCRDMRNMMGSTTVANDGVERSVGEENWDCLDKDSGIGYKCKERLENHRGKVKSWSEGKGKLAD